MVRAGDSGPAVVGGEQVPPTDRALGLTGTGVQVTSCLTGAL